jgi:hypothetical protein
MDIPEPSSVPERTEMTPEAQRLRRLIRFNEPGAPIGAPVVLLMWWFYRTPSTLIIAGLVAFTFVIQRIAIHYTERNRIQEGITALSIAPVELCRA